MWFLFEENAEMVGRNKYVSLTKNASRLAIEN